MNRTEIEYCEAKRHLSRRQLAKINKLGGPNKFRYFILSYVGTMSLKIAVVPKEEN